MRWLSDVLLAVHAERLGRSMVNMMIAGSITLRPVPPAFFAFVLGADGGWDPCMLNTDATWAYKSLERCWPAVVDGYKCGSVPAGYLTCRQGDSLHSCAPVLLGFEEGLVGWLVAHGYGAEAASVHLNGGNARVVRVTW
jgi:hypothetical protein